MVTWCPTKNFGPIGSAVLTFIGYKHTDKQTKKQTDKPNLYIEDDIEFVTEFPSFLGHPVVVTKDFVNCNGWDFYISENI